MRLSLVGVLVLAGLTIADDRPFVATPFTAEKSFTAGIEGPACDAKGNVYVVNFAEQGTGRIYLHLQRGAAVWADADALRRALEDADTRAGIAAIVPDATLRAVPQPHRPALLGDEAGFEQRHTLGEWGTARS